MHDENSLVGDNIVTDDDDDDDNNDDNDDNDDVDINDNIDEFTGDNKNCAKEYHLQGPNDNEVVVQDYNLPYIPSPRVPFGGDTALIHNIASFLTVSDAMSLVSMVQLSEKTPSPIPFRESINDDDPSEATTTPDDSWAVGMELDGSIWSMETPPTPAVIAISPGATPRLLQSDEELSVDGVEDHHHHREDPLESDCSIHRDTIFLVDKLRERRRRWAQEKITAAVFAHPKPLRAYCVDAFDAAMRIKHLKQSQSNNQSTITIQFDNSVLENHTESIPIYLRKRKRTNQERGLQLLNVLTDNLFHNVPLSVVLEIVQRMCGLSLDTTVASFQITLTSINNIISALGQAIQYIWSAVRNFNPLQLLEAIISLQFSAMGKTSEVLASGIQSVATGVGSASSMALYRLSAANLSVSRLESYSSFTGTVSQRIGRTTSDDFMKKKLIRKLSTINDAALAVSYREIEDDTGGLTKHAVTRTRRMMHYTVPLRPFLATVALSSSTDNYSLQKCRRLEGSLGDLSFDSSDCSSAETTGSPFMCTPHSFPPTPHSRQMIIAQRAQFSDDIIFIARDRLRVFDGLKSDDERTRERSRVLADEKRLAIFAHNDAASGIELSCGRHIATKIGHMYYASTRSMIPVLRNCFVYFELTVLPTAAITNDKLPEPVATLSIGISTEEMPPNTLVGAWQGSVGLCSTGQILIAGQWCSPADPIKSSFGTNSTVGCLVYLDDESAFETWDGLMLRATVTFNVNGMIVSQPVSTLPMSGSPSSLSVTKTPPNVSGNSDRNAGEHAPSSSLQTATLTLLVPAVEDLYPTLTIQSFGTAVVCRFSSEDIAANSRVAIGAPDNVTVYAIDGSVILNQNE